MEHQKQMSSFGAVTLMRRVYKFVLPSVNEHLNSLTAFAQQIPNVELRTQALASIRDKKFHCQGGGVYAIFNLEAKDTLIKLIVSLQTISDYLDNLCDRSTSLDENDFRLLHQSMLDAVTPQANLCNYYERREDQDDRGYLHHLVTTCQEMINRLPSYHLVQHDVIELVQLYCDLQVYKHIIKHEREPKLIAWWENHKDKASKLKWNEFAAATGSTLGMFHLFMAASYNNLSEANAKQIKKSYFPYVCCLHIMLDYLIDQEEDKLGGDLNFCNYFSSQEEMIQRIEWIVAQARAEVKALPHGKVHRLIIEGLLALYLSDPKVSNQEEVKHIRKQLMKHSPLTRLFFLVNSIWIRNKQA